VSRLTDLLLWNGLILLYALLLGVLLVQHGIFYSFPPNMDNIVVVNPLVYIFLMFAIFAFWKFSSYAEERAKVLPEEEEE